MAQGKADFNQPIKIEADNESFDLGRNTAVFENNVAIRQGTLLIRADRLDAVRDREQQLEIFTAKGSPATYTQELDDGEAIRAQATEIEYDRIKQTLILRGSAELNQNDSLIRGDIITYDFINQQLRTERSEDSKDRVTTIFMPRAGTDEASDEKNGNNDNDNDATNPPDDEEQN